MGSEPLNTNSIRELTTQINSILFSVDDYKSKWMNATGEVKGAYELIYKDQLWRLSRKVGQLWFYINECAIVPIEEIIAS